MRLGVVFTTRAGSSLGRPITFADWSVEVPLNDSRTGKFTISIFDPVAVHVKPLETFVRFYWGDWIVMNGPILNPVWNGAEGTVEVNCHDPSIWLKNHYLRYGDPAVDDGYSADGEGIWQVLACAFPSDYQIGLGVPVLPIAGGVSWSDATLGSRKADRGANVWEVIQNTTELLPGPDFDLKPVDQQTLDSAFEVSTDQGPVVMFDTYEQLMVDRSRPGQPGAVSFMFGFGLGNLSDYVLSPDGASVRNNQVIVYPGGQTSPVDEEHRGIADNYPSQIKYGEMEGWESGGQRDSKTMLERKAHVFTGLYDEPLENVEATVKPDSAARFMRDFYLGDVARFQARRGALQADVRARIMGVTLEQVEGTMEGVETLSVVPYRTLVLDADDPPAPSGGGVVACPAAPAGAVALGAATGRVSDPYNSVISWAPAEATMVETGSYFTTTGGDPSGDYSAAVYRFPDYILAGDGSVEFGVAFQGDTPDWEPEVYCGLAAVDAADAYALANYYGDGTDGFLYPLSVLSGSGETWGDETAVPGNPHSVRVGVSRTGDVFTFYVNNAAGTDTLAAASMELVGIPANLCPCIMFENQNIGAGEQPDLRACWFKLNGGS